MTWIPVPLAAALVLTLTSNVEAQTRPASPDSVLVEVVQRGAAPPLELHFGVREREGRSCRVPCDLELAPGTYDMGVSLAGRRAPDTLDSVTIGADSRLVLRRTPGPWYRWLPMVVGIVGALMTLPAMAYTAGNPGRKRPLRWTGVGLGLVGVGFTLMFTLPGPNRSFDVSASPATL